jgi:hypothetical protein
MIAHPPMKPTRGPSTRVAHVKIVPQSGSARLRAACPKETERIGTKASRTIACAWNPT